QQIFKRTNTENEVRQKLRNSGDEHANRPSTPGDNSSDAKAGKDIERSNTGTPGKEKKKGVSFLSRFIGNKKKAPVDDGNNEDESEAGEARPEGMEAELFSQPIDNIGFSPRHPQPPGYIKIRSKFKRQREYDRVFLAQELRGKPTSVENDGRPRTSSGTSANASNPRATGNDPIWATEFSKDGKYLAAGGQDKVVRVWAVISTAEERRAHEREEEKENGAAGGQALHLSAPVFQKKAYREYAGHESTILDLSWSKNNFLLSSSMDKTVRLWHISRAECLCTFKHADFVPSIQFHPKDDRFFLAGSLDTKLRLWSIPDKSVAYVNHLPEMITAVAFTPDGKTAIAGTLSGLCLFYETEGLKYQTQIHVRSSHGKNARGSKITGIQAMDFGGMGNPSDLKLLISSNDSRIRLYNARDKSLEVKFKGQQNTFSQIRATFSDDGASVICGSEDRKAYIWSTGPGADGDNAKSRNQRPVEMFEAHASITTCAILAPQKTRQLLSQSEDPLYDLCNPPPVTLMSRTESITSSNKANTLNEPSPTFKLAQQSPAYIARSAHPGGQIIVTSDYTGQLKVFRQDCAHRNRASNTNNPQNWDS
ncbi:WD40 repeat-like protein, partial [Saccharata proteae CBS 121410]